MRYFFIMAFSRNHFLFLALIVMTVTACNCSEKKQKQLEQRLIDIDREFSELSAKMGSHDAFLYYMDDSCVLLRPNRNPVIGRENIEAIYSKPDTSFTLTWEPLSADISSSGDLGYTYGTYTVKMDSPTGEAVEKKGTYVTIWKKDRKGNWKFVLDTGNQGLGPQNSETE
jgi:ketosteroid isomerase-like protein